MSVNELVQSETRLVKVAVLSDIHAYDVASESDRPSHVCVTDAEDQPYKNPLLALSRLVAADSLSADVLICAGDLTDRSRAAGIQHSWRWLQAFKQQLGCAVLIVTPGNHDLDSRHRDADPDPRGTLQSLKPPFPYADEGINDHFWSRHFAVTDHDVFKIVNLNSSAYHGLHDEEIKHGSITERTLQRLTDKLDSMPARPLNILVCHHHPQQHMEAKLGEYDVMSNGQLLLELLGSGRFGEWLVVHGHKHHPKVAYASGGAASPVVFSAGSAAAILYPELGTLARNQFYEISIPLEEVSRRGLVGTIRAWDWSYGYPWRTASLRSGLPPVSGFGFRGSLAVLAQRIADVVTEPLVRWERMATFFPEVAFLLPQDYDTLVESLLRQNGLDVTRDANGLLLELGRQ